MCFYGNGNTHKRNLSFFCQLKTAGEAQKAGRGNIYDPLTPARSDTKSKNITSHFPARLFLLGARGSADMKHSGESEIWGNEGNNNMFLLSGGAASAAGRRERDDGETERAAEESQIKVALGEKVGRNLKHFHSARVCARACDTELCCPFPLSPRQNGRARRVCSVTSRCLSARRRAAEACGSCGSCSSVPTRPCVSEHPSVCGTSKLLFSQQDQPRN